MADTFKYVQAQPFSLSGGGAVSGATTVILKSFAQIDGTLLTMTDFGNIGFGTLEPGNGTLEEQISFTGVTQNTNGTATLTGVSSVTMVSPYTATSGLSQTHAGSTTFVISNTSGFYDRLSAKADDETITGTWTFTNPNYPRMDTDSPFPTDNEQLATKAYADSLTFSGAPDATTSQKGIVQLPTQAQVDAKTALGSTGASLTVTPATQRSTLESDYVVDTGAADAYAIAPSPVISAYSAGQIFTWKAAHTNTTTSTLAVNGLTTKTIKKLDGATNLTAGDITAGQVVYTQYDGTNFQMLSPSAVSALPALSAGVINEFVTTTNGTSFSFGRPFDYQLFTGSGTWTKPTNLSGNEMVFIQVWGGGGGGSSAAGTGGAGGGGGAGYAEFKARASDLGATVTVTIGGGGAANTAGTSTTFGAIVTGYGGGKGADDNAGGGGGGGGGVLALGGNGSTSTGGTGGSPDAGAHAAAGGFGGGGGGSGEENGGPSGWGGGGGGGGKNTGAGGARPSGGSSLYGGGGGAGGDNTAGGHAAGSGGTSLYGGTGGASGTNAGTAPGGGGGGANSTGTGGAGASGQCRVFTFL